MTSYAGVDLGATHVRAQVTDADGAPLGEERRDTPQSDGAAIERAVAATLRAACVDAGVGPADVAAAGVGSMGPLDREAGAVVGPTNVPAERVAVVVAVRRVVDCPVALRNDAVAAAVGERAFADAPPDLVYLTLSTGVGAGAVVDGHVLNGARGNAGEVGHFVVEPDGRPCGCGGRGHWEAYCSGESIPAVARDLARGETALDLDDLDAAAVFAAAGDDPLADRVLDRVATYNAIGVADLVHAFAPALVSVGGAVALHNEALVLDPIRERLDRHLAVPAPDVRATPLGADAGLRGAVACAMRIHKG
ncbi:MAG: ROK family protein [Haloarculaceae archaeon]